MAFKAGRAAMRPLPTAAGLFFSTMAGAQTVGLHPDFPVVRGAVRLGDDWALTLAEPHNRRVEDGSLVLWRPGFTVWVNLWGNDDRQSVADRLSRIRGDISGAAFGLEESAAGPVARLSYRLEGPGPDGTVHALYGFAVGPGGHVQIAIYFDAESDLPAARTIVASVRTAGP